MVSKMMYVFYGENRLPYKDKERQVHYPIIEPAFQGSSQANEIKFYIDQIGGIGLQWMVVAKLPSGKVGTKLLTTGTDDNGEYALLKVSSWFTQEVGNVFLSLRGYDGGCTIQYDSETGLYTISGDPIVQTTGSVNMVVKYATQTLPGDNVGEITTQEILAAIGDRLKKEDGKYCKVVDNISNINTATYSDYLRAGDIVYDKHSNDFYLLSGTYPSLVSSKVNHFVDISTNQSVGGHKTFTSEVTIMQALEANNILDLSYGNNANSLTKVARIVPFTVDENDFVAFSLDPEYTPQNIMAAHGFYIGKLPSNADVVYVDTLDSDGIHFNCGISGVIKNDVTNEYGLIAPNTSSWTDHRYIATEDYAKDSSKAVAQTFEASVNTTTYVLTFTFKDPTTSEVIRTQTIDLPIESVVVSGSYDDTTESIVLVLQSGQTISIPVGDLVSGLVSTSDLSTALADYYTKTQIDNFKFVRNLGELSNITVKQFADTYGVGVYFLRLRGADFLLVLRDITAQGSTGQRFTGFAVQGASSYKQLSYGTILTNGSYLFDALSGGEQYLRYKHFTDTTYCNNLTTPQVFLYAISGFSGYFVGQATTSGSGDSIRNIVEIESLNTKDRYFYDVTGSTPLTSLTLGDVINDTYKQVYAIDSEVEKVANKVTSISGSSTDTQYPSAKCVWDNLQDVREVAEGKCKAWVLSYADTISSVKAAINEYPSRKFYLYNYTSKEWEDKTTELFAGDYDAYTIDNYHFNSQSNDIGSVSHYLIFRSVSAGTSNVNIGDFLMVLTQYDIPIDEVVFGIGDIFYVIETDVPDRWYAGGETPYYFYKLETALSNYYVKNMNLIPSSDATYDVGSSSYRYKNGHFSGYLYLNGGITDATGTYTVDAVGIYTNIYNKETTNPQTFANGWNVFTFSSATTIMYYSPATGTHPEYKGTMENLATSDVVITIAGTINNFLTNDDSITFDTTTGNLTLPASTKVEFSLIDDSLIIVNFGA